MMIHFIIAFVLSFSIGFADDPCRFEYPGKCVIDLTTVGHTDGTAAFCRSKGNVYIWLSYVDDVLLELLKNLF